MRIGLDLEMSFLSANLLTALVVLSTIGARCRIEVKLGEFGSSSSFVVFSVVLESEHLARRRTEAIGSRSSKQVLRFWG